MKKLSSCFIIVLVLVALAVPMQIAGAQEPTPGTAEDNLCFGPWTACTVEGDQAKTEWNWTCGWYMARVNSGKISPQWVIANTNCDSAVTLPKTPFCANAFYGDSALVDPNNGTLTIFDRHGCDGAFLYVDQADVIASNQLDAHKACQDQGWDSAFPMAWNFPGTPADMYNCYDYWF